MSANQYYNRTKNDVNAGLLGHLKKFKIPLCKGPCGECKKDVTEDQGRVKTVKDGTTTYYHEECWKKNK